MSVITLFRSTLCRLEGDWRADHSSSKVQQHLSGRLPLTYHRMPFPDNLRRIRLEQFLSQAEPARRSGVHPLTVTRLETPVISLAVLEESPAVHNGHHQIQDDDIRTLDAQAIGAPSTI
jgi:hypothetical protein